MNKREIDLREFNDPDPKDPNYSMLEVDLPAKTGLSLRKNLITKRFEIFNIRTKEVVFSGDIMEVAVYAHRNFNDEYFIKRYVE